MEWLYPETGFWSSENYRTWVALNCVIIEIDIFISLPTVTLLSLSDASFHEQKVLQLLAEKLKDMPVVELDNLQMFLSWNGCLIYGFLNVYQMNIIYAYRIDW